MSICLVIIDVQKGFMTEETNFLPDRIRSLLKKEKYDYIVATQFKNRENSPYTNFMKWHDMMDEESQKLDEFVQSVADRIFVKYINSCFTDEFCEYIREKKIDKLYFVGLDTECCVLKSAFDSFDKNIPFQVLGDYCASSAGKEIHRIACTVMKSAIGKDSVK